MSTDADHASLPVGRLLNAVDSLLSEQATVLQAERYDAFLELQQRTLPLVAHIAELIGDDTASGLGFPLSQRGRAVLRRMKDLESLVADHRQRISVELGTLNASLSRTQRLRPVYQHRGGQRDQTSLLAHA